MNDDDMTLLDKIRKRLNAFRDRRKQPRKVLIIGNQTSPHPTYFQRQFLKDDKNRTEKL